MLHLKSTPQAFYGIKASSSIWHARFCHPSPAVTNELVTSFYLPCNKEKSVTCLDCIQAKSHRLPFYPSTTSSEFSLQLVHSDV
jgi:GAG-pre-integrase domain